MDLQTLLLVVMHTGESIGSQGQESQLVERPDLDRDGAYAHESTRAAMCAAEIVDRSQQST